jgi:hypothetical protein
MTAYHRISCLNPFSLWHYLYDLRTRHAFLLFTTQSSLPRRTQAAVQPHIRQTFITNGDGAGETSIVTAIKNDPTAQVRCLQQCIAVIVPSVPFACSFYLVLALTFPYSLLSLPPALPLLALSHLHILLLFPLLP